ncbi:hypothetical protein DSO57_1009245 [Entomophthora muscae]|uniref:Uncharacterized protein n=1 Tax=Entomophthora muscae TaxID=34485 RepID=A0ACC2THS6_9FUNG|nr:hypothetical protein DSO57_1009245 [Entomophthora muscae]
MLTVRQSLHVPSARTLMSSSFSLNKSVGKKNLNWIKGSSLDKKTLQRLSGVEALEFYHYSNSSHVFMVRVMAILQGLFWLNFGQLAYTKLGKYNEDTGKSELLEHWKRALAAGLTVILAAGIGTGLFAYTKKLPFRVTLLGKSSKLKVETDRWPLKNKVELYDVDTIAAKERLIPGDKVESFKKNKFFFRDLKGGDSFMLELNGKFNEVEYFNHLFHKPGAFKK